MLLGLIACGFSLIQAYCSALIANSDERSTTERRTDLVRGNVTIMHYHQTTSTVKPKRDISRIINTCERMPPAFSFRSSRCSRSTNPPGSLSPQAYMIMCWRFAQHINGVLHPGEGRTSHGSCSHDEICVESEMHTPGFPFDIVASCVPIQNYLLIGHILLQKTEFGSIQIPIVQPAGDQILFADAVMADPTMKVMVEARYINMSALRQFSAIHETPQFGQIPGGVWSCVDCSNIGPVAVPMEISRLAASVTIASGSAGVLYITTAFSG